MNRTASRRAFIRTGSAVLALPAIGLLPRAADAADFTFKCGHDLPASHPVHVRLLEAATRITEESKGRFSLQVFGNNQLGGDTDMLSQVRSGGLEMSLIPDVVLGTLSPAASISGVGFAFGTDEDACKAMDGEVGAYVRASLAKVGLATTEKIWENGFRQITSSVRPIRTPDDLKGFKIRVPVSPLWVSLFKAFGAGPTALNFSELYTALQTKVVEGQENPLTTINAGKLYEVQKFCSISNHVWNGYWMLMNPRLWSAVPKDIQDIVSNNLNRSAMDLRTDVAALNLSLQKTLTERGMAFNTVDPAPFRAALAKAGFYSEWSSKFGTEAWTTLRKYANGIT